MNLPAAENISEILPLENEFTIPERSQGFMLAISFVVGIVGGLAAVVFRGMIGFFHNLLYYGQLSIGYNANIHSKESLWGIGIILVPIIGSIGVTWLIRTFAPEAKGHGVPEVIDAIYRKKGVIRPAVVLIKALASALTIGSGGSVGREGPIIQIGSAFGSVIGQWLRMPARQRIVLVAAGAGAGISATFNAPLGGIAFAIELLLVTVNASTLSVVALATVTATYIGRVLFGNYPEFNIASISHHSFQIASVWKLLLFLPFGALMGVTATFFLKSIYWFEDRFTDWFTNPYWRHIFGMTFMGVLMFVLMHYTGKYYVDGVGYATIIDILNQTLAHPSILLLLFVLKLMATGTTIGSGGSGGVFSPSLFLGATLGAAFGAIVSHFLPNIGLSSVEFAVCGMAALVAGSTGAVVTALVMTYEMTHDYNVILPMILSVVLAHWVRKMLSPESIYTLKLLRRGQPVHEGLQAALYSGQQARHVMTADFGTIQQNELSSVQNSLFAKQNTAAMPIVIISGHQIISVLPAFHHIDAVAKRFIVVSPDLYLPKILALMQAHHVDVALVSRNEKQPSIDDLEGIISSREIAIVSQRLAELMN